MRIEEAWIQASGTTGVDQIGAEMGTGFAVLVLSLEVAWWIGFGLFLKKRSERNSDGA